MSKNTTNIHVSGSRKRAVARATLKPGKGNVKINNKPLSEYTPQLYRERIQEPLNLAGVTAQKVDLYVRAHGGGFSSQADAIRLAIARALVQHDGKLKTVMSDYDRLLLVADVRRKEASKPGRHGKARAKRQKSYR